MKRIAEEGGTFGWLAGVSKTQPRPHRRQTETLPGRVELQRVLGPASGEMRTARTPPAIVRQS
jgi:hypothetical protein